MIQAERVKEIMFSLGADLCGIASVDRFDDAPEGYHPLDVLPTCKSVISFGCRFPVGTLICKSAIPYTRVRNSITPKMDAIALDFCIEMEKNQIVCVPIPTNESKWDSNTGRKRSIVSQKHAAKAAGLGTIGRHSLLITPEFGSMLWLGTVLCEKEFEPDEKQQSCWEFAFGDDEEEKVWKISCHKCRDICPYNLGRENSFLQSNNKG